MGGHGGRARREGAIGGRRKLWRNDWRVAVVVFGQNEQLVVGGDEVIVGRAQSVGAVGHDANGDGVRKMEGHVAESDPLQGLAPAFAVDFGALEAQQVLKHVRQPGLAGAGEHEAADGVVRHDGVQPRRQRAADQLQQRHVVEHAHLRVIECSEPQTMYKNL